jgi:flagellum-specific peptidoglycan hydrolase FlgJ
LLNREQFLFLQKVTPAALEQQRIYGIPAAVTIAQAILESCWGRSILVSKANNYFGIKYSHIQGTEDYGHFDVATWEVENGHRVDCTAAFQKFPDDQECFTRHSLLLMRPRYRAAYAEGGNWQKFAALLGPKTPENPSACGYSTNPDYAAELTKLVEIYHLDDPAALAAYSVGKEFHPQITPITQMEKVA